MRHVLQPTSHAGSRRRSSIDSPLFFLCSVLWGDKSNMSRKFPTLALLGALAFAPSAMAQSSTCRWVFNEWTCQGPHRGVDMMGAVRAGQDAARPNPSAQPQAGQNDDNDGTFAAFLEQRRSRQLRAKVGKLIADGKCPDARQAALKAGDFALVHEIEGLCRTGTEG